MATKASEKKPAKKAKKTGKQEIRRCPECEHRPKMEKLEPLHLAVSETDRRKTSRAVWRCSSCDYTEVTVKTVAALVTKWVADLGSPEGAFTVRIPKTLRDVLGQYIKETGHTSLNSFVVSCLADHLIHRLRFTSSKVK